MRKNAHAAASVPVRCLLGCRAVSLFCVFCGLLCYVMRTIYRKVIMDEMCTNSTSVRIVTTIPNMFEVKGSYSMAETWAFGDFSDPKRQRDYSLSRDVMEYREFSKGSYSFSLITIDWNKEIVPVVILHQENIDPSLLVKSWLDSNQQTGNPVKDPECTGNEMEESWKDQAVEYRTDTLEEAVAVNCNGRFCFVNYTEFLFATYVPLAPVPKLKLAKDKNWKSELAIHKVEIDSKIAGVAIDPNDIFGDAELSSTLFDDSVGRCYALALHKNASDLHEPERDIPIESVLYGNTYRSFYNDGNHIENPHYCLDATVDGSDFSILPDTVFVKILLYVPWCQRILSRRVNKRWMKLCNVAISIDTKIIRQGSQQFQRMNTDDLWRLLPIVSDTLEEIKWQELCGTQRLLLEVLHQIPAFRNLRIINIGGGKLDYVTFFSLLDKCPNLRELRALVPTASSTDYSPGTYQVKKLILPWTSKVNDSYLNEIINHFPSLIDLRCECAYVTADDFSLVIGTYGENLEHLQIHFVAANQSNAYITGMEKCHNLEYLDLTSAHFLSDACLKDVANGCQKLRTLDITRYGKVTNAGLIALASLPNLKELNISSIFKDLSLGISQIAKQGHLEQLLAQYVPLSVACLKDCARYCRQLKQLDIMWNRMANQVEVEDAKEIIYLFNGWSLSPLLLFRTNCKVWTHCEVKQLRQEQKESGQRRFVVFCVHHNHDPGFIQDDQSVSSQESTDPNEDENEDWLYNSDDDQLAPDEMDFSDDQLAPGEMN